MTAISGKKQFFLPPPSKGLNTSTNPALIENDEAQILVGSVELDGSVSTNARVPGAHTEILELAAANFTDANGLYGYAKGLNAVLALSTPIASDLDRTSGTSNYRLNFNEILIGINIQTRNEPAVAAPALTRGPVFVYVRLVYPDDPTGAATWSGAVVPIDGGTDPANNEMHGDPTAGTKYNVVCSNIIRGSSGTATYWLVYMSSYVRGAVNEYRIHPWRIPYGDTAGGLIYWPAGTPYILDSNVTFADKSDACQVPSLRIFTHQTRIGVYSLLGPRIYLSLPAGDVSTMDDVSISLVGEENPVIIDVRSNNETMWIFSKGGVYIVSGSMLDYQKRKISDAVLVGNGFCSAEAGICVAYCEDGVYLFSESGGAQRIKMKINMKDTGTYRPKPLYRQLYPTEETITAVVYSRDIGFVGAHTEFDGKVARFHFTPIATGDGASHGGIEVDVETGLWCRINDGFRTGAKTFFETHIAKFVNKLDGSAYDIVACPTAADVATWPKTVGKVSLRYAKQATQSYIEYKSKHTDFNSIYKKKLRAVRLLFRCLGSGTPTVTVDVYGDDDVTSIATVSITLSTANKYIGTNEYVLNIGETVALNFRYSVRVKMSTEANEQALDAEYCGAIFEFEEKPGHRDMRATHGQV